MDDARSRSSDGARLSRGDDCWGSRGGGSWLIWLVAMLAAIAFVQAYLLFPLLFRDESDPEGLVSDQNLPEARITVYYSSGEPALLLKRPMDHSTADRLSSEELDRQIFPGGDRHEYYELHAVNAGGGEAVVDLGRNPVILEQKEGPSIRPVDLADAVRERGAALPPFLRLYLSEQVPTQGRVSLAAGESRTVLIAYRATENAPVPESARIGERRLSRELWKKDELDRRLEFPSLLPKSSDP